MENKNLTPWLNPDESVEVLEILADVEAVLRNTARFGSMRKELRRSLESEAAKVQEFAQRARRDAIDYAMILALEEVAKQKKVPVEHVILEALETYISAFNRRRA